MSFKREKFTQNLWDTAGFSPTAPTDPFTNSLTESPVNLKEFLSIVCIFWWFEVFHLKKMQQHSISSFDSRGKNMSIEFKGQPIIFMHVFNDGCCHCFKYNVHINMFLFLFFLTLG